MTGCTIARRRRCREAARRLDSFDVVAAVDVFPPHQGGLERWTVEGVLYHSEIPSAVLDVLGAAELSLDPDITGTRGDPVQTEFVAHAV